MRRVKALPSPKEKREGRARHVLEKEVVTLSQLLVDFVGVSQGNLGGPDVRRHIRQIVCLITNDTDALASVQVCYLLMSLFGIFCSISFYLSTAFIC